MTAPQIKSLLLDARLPRLEVRMLLEHVLDKPRAWLLAHRQFGPLIHGWEAQGAVSRRAKRLATLMMVACAVVMFLTAPALWMAATGTAIMAVVAAWLWRRPEPR